MDHMMDKVIIANWAVVQDDRSWWLICEYLWNATRSSITKWDCKL